MIAVGCDNEQPIDLSTGSRADTPLRNHELKTSLQNGIVPKQENPDFLTPVVLSSSSSSTSVFRPSPSVPEPPSKRSFDDMQAEFWYSSTPPVSSTSSFKYCAPSTSSTCLNFKKARLHSPERKRFIWDFNRFIEPSSPPSSSERSGSPLLPPEFKIPTMTRMQKSPRVRTSREKSPMGLGGAPLTRGDSPLNGYLPSCRSVSNSPAYPDEHQPSYNSRFKIPDDPSSYLQDLNRNNGIQTSLLEALQTATNVRFTEHQDDPNSTFPIGNLINQSRWPQLDVTPSGTSASTNNAHDNLYKTYMYLNYLPYLLYGKTEADRQRLESARELDPYCQQTSSHQREATSSLNNLYSSYLTSLLTASEHQPALQPETPVPSHLTPSTTASSSTSTSSLINTHPFLFGQAQPPIASSSSFSPQVISPKGKHPKKKSNWPETAASTSWGASTFSQGLLYPEPSSNHRFADFPFLPNKKPFVRASSFDDNLVRSQSNFGPAEKSFHPDFYSKESFAHLGCSSRDNSHLFRLNSSLPNLPISILESTQRSLAHNVDLTGVGELLSKLTEPDSVRDTHKRDDLQNKNINMINIHNFNNIKDLYSINDVHKFIQGNINGTFSKRESRGTTPEARESSPGFHPEHARGDSDTLKSSQSSTSNDTSNQDAASEVGDNNESSSSSGVGIRKKPTRALTGRHVRSGTGASVSTLASLREKLKERRNQAPTSTPTTSRSTTRGRGRRRHLAI